MNLKQSLSDVLSGFLIGGALTGFGIVAFNLGVESVKIPTPYGPTGHVSFPGKLVDFSKAVGNSYPEYTDRVENILHIATEQIKNGIPSEDILGFINKSTDAIGLVFND